MEKLFSPNRWFVLFCALLIVIWGALKLVGDMNLAQEATVVAEDLFTWSWTAGDISLASAGNAAPSVETKSVRSSIQGIKAQVIKRDAHEATVEVKGTQMLQKYDNNSNGPSTASAEQKEQAKATLTFYRLNNDWELGKVELK